jgi:para-aminobenzoate synthetase component 1
MFLLTKTIAFTQGSLSLLEIFKDEDKLFFLDSSLSGNRDGRFSYLGFAPFDSIEARDLVQLRKALKPYLGFKSSLPFHCGAVGYIGYEGEIWFGLYGTVLCIDHQEGTLTITSTGFPYKDLSRQRKAAQQSQDYILFKLDNHRPSGKVTRQLKKKPVLQSNTSPAQYMAAVKKALGHIHDGDIYQINLSQRMQADIRNWRQYAHPVDVYKELRTLSPSSFSAYLDQGEQVILSSSPERFLKLEDDQVQVRPMKGTRPRGKNVREDQKNRQELLESAKEKAELLMVTDLERNDLGRVCDYGSVKVKAMRQIEEYSTVFQATSTIEGRLHRDFDQFDLLKSTFPSGSVTGCPKIEAMKIIQQLERSKRGLYTGALGYISFTGDMDFNVLIRTLFLEKDRITFHVGGGIVADSDPKKEYEETLVKAKAMAEALKNVF